MRRYANEVFRAEGVSVQIRVGLNSGEVVVRAIGSDLHMDYTAVGQTSHLAARMEQLAEPGRILMTPGTLRLAEGFVEVASRGLAPVKGLAAPVEVYELKGAAYATRLRASAERGLTRFVGRDLEVEQLARSLEKAGGGHGQVVAVVGEPGVGKSRLLWEFTRSHRVRGWLIVESRSVSYGQATLWLAAVELLRNYFQVERSDDSRKIRERVTGKLLALDRVLEAAVPALLWLLEVSTDDAVWERLDPPQRRQLALDAVKRLLLRESHVQPLVIVMEDLHWIDTESQALLDGLVESLPAARLLLFVNYRPEYQHAWGGRTYYTQVRLDPLPPASAQELLASLLGSDPVLAPLKRRLIERTGGNPFFLEETVRTLVETGVLASDRGAYRLERSSETLEIPPTVEAVLAARIDRLAAEDKRLLQAAAAIGMDVPFALLRAIADVGEDVLRASLGRLQASEFLCEARLFPDLEHMFKHGLTHDVAYRSLLQDRRRALHARIAAAIEAHYPDRLAEHVERLAYHASRGELWEKAAAYGHEAGRRYLERSAYRDAVAYLEQALAAVSHLPERRDALERAFDVRLDLGRALLPLGEGTRRFERLTEAEALGRKLGDSGRLGWLAVLMTNQLHLVGRATEARRYGETAMEQAEARGEATLKIAANFFLGQAEVYWGEYGRAEEHLRRVIDLLEGDPTGIHRAAIVVPAVGVRSLLAAVHAKRGEFGEGLRVGEEALRIAESLRHPYSETYALRFLALLHLSRGDLRAVAALCERGLAVGREAGIHNLLPYLSSYLGYSRVLTGAADEGVRLLRKAIEARAASGFRYGMSQMVGMLGEGLLLANHYDEASEEAQRGMSLAVECTERSNQAELHRLLGEIATRREPWSPALAEDHYQQCLTLASELGMRPLVTHCHLGLGKLYRRTGKQQAAQEHLTAATTMYREMGMTYWLEQAEAEMRELQDGR